MASAIEEIIEEIEDYIDNCKPATFSSTKIVVNRDEMEVLLNDLKEKTPEVIRTCEKVVNNQEAIIADAERKAEKILQSARNEAESLLSEQQIMTQAYIKGNEVVMLSQKKAEQILNDATNDANTIREGAINYTDSMLKALQEIISTSMDTTQNTLGGFMTSMKSYYDLIATNRMELSPSQTREELMRHADVASPQAENTHAPEPQKQESHKNEPAKEEHPGEDNYIDTLQDTSETTNIPEKLDQFFNQK